MITSVAAAALLSSAGSAAGAVHPVVSGAAWALVELQESVRRNRGLNPPPVLDPRGPSPIVVWVARCPRNGAGVIFSPRTGSGSGLSIAVPSHASPVRWWGNARPATTVGAVLLAPACTGEEIARLVERGGDATVVVLSTREQVLPAGAAFAGGHVTVGATLLRPNVPTIVCVQAAAGASIDVGDVLTFTAPPAGLSSATAVCSAALCSGALPAGVSLAQSVSSAIVQPFETSFTGQLFHGAIYVQDPT